MLRVNAQNDRIKAIWITKQNSCQFQRGKNNSQFSSTQNLITHLLLQYTTQTK